MPLANYTRRSASIPRRLLREGKPHLLPVYGLMLTSDLAREGIHRSGSFRFADHVYLARPSGRFGIGILLDALLLRLPAARSMRNRYLHSRDQVVAEVRRRRGGGPLVVVSAPCGIARELVEAADLLRLDGGDGLVAYHGVDLDGEALDLSKRLAGDRRDFTFTQGDVFDRASYPADADVIVSTGLVDFLDDAESQRFLGVCHSVLRPGGLLVTSAQQPHRLADYLMREIAELRPFYRGPAEISALARGAGFADVEPRRDDVGLQTLLTARKHGATT